MIPKHGLERLRSIPLHRDPVDALKQVQSLEGHWLSAVADYQRRWGTLPPTEFLSVFFKRETKRARSRR